MQPDATLTGGDKRDRILDAALMLFLRYGVKRTSIDDIAREVGIAKGTIYLSFDSKVALFAAIADRLCASTLSDAEQIASGVTPPTERIVELLDCYIGRMHRLIAQSPHIAELTASREALATQAFQTLDGQVCGLLNAVLSEAGIDRDGADAMFIAAALGTLQTGDATAQPYRARLSAMVETLVAGLACLTKA